MLDEQQLLAVGQHLVGVLAAGHIEINGIHRFHGGASRETYGLDVKVDGVPRGLILRRDPVDSLIDTARSLEFAAYQSFAGTPVPVPEAICLVETGELIGSPFFVMERIDGGEVGGPMTRNAYGDHRDQIGRQFFDYLGEIHRIDPLATPLASEVDVPEAAHCWARELDYWAGVIAKDRMMPEPIGEAAIRWLRRNPPPPPERLTVVHGDYRNGNVLHDGTGRIIAVLDWEMAHIGDPHEDLAWAMDPLFAQMDDSRAAGLLPRAEAIALWEKASGLSFDPAAFRWWEVFASLKGLAIWISSGKAWQDAANTDPILAFSGLYTKTVANSTLVKLISGEGAIS